MIGGRRLPESIPKANFFKCKVAIVAGMIAWLSSS